MEKTRLLVQKKPWSQSDQLGLRLNNTCSEAGCFLKRPIQTRVKAAVALLSQFDSLFPKKPRQRWSRKRMAGGALMLPGVKVQRPLNVKVLRRRPAACRSCHVPTKGLALDMLVTPTAASKWATSGLILSGRKTGTAAGKNDAHW
ncbi:hypothetical protein Vafri_6534 [Volvox africanus]|uniref:Uncharacterized protein n=1 Tax=Volvox africanus TaxID=51714 RepID=A0A8J4AZF1_9CHLO|nr:hypothetical protein Vafri_6534 [Volvox africanus]